MGGGLAREFHTEISHHKNRLLESLAANALVYFGRRRLTAPAASLREREGEETETGET